MIGRTLAGVAVVAYSAKALNLNAEAASQEGGDDSNADTTVDPEDAYMKFVSVSGVHLHSKAEFDDKFDNFKVAHANVLSHNADSSSTFKMGHNEFSVMSAGEKKEHLGLQSVPEVDGLATYAETPILAEATQSSVDWRSKGAVNAVVNQGGCGSCWAFAAVAPYEQLVHSVTGKLKKYSEQQINSCYTRYGGCTGGHHYMAWAEYTSKHKMALDCKYPYTDGKTRKTSACTMSSAKQDRDSFLTQGKHVGGQTVSGMRSLIAQRVLGIAVNAGCDSFYGYKSGIYNTGCGTRLDHAVNLVGYGDGYYILRNSWGTGWGDGGYMKIAAKDGKGVSGCQMDVSYPTKA